MKFTPGEKQEAAPKGCNLNVLKRARDQYYLITTLAVLPLL